MTTQLNRLSDALSVDVDASERVIIYDASACTPVVKLVLEPQEINALIAFWHDGYCAGCGTGIPQHHSLCQNCLIEEMHTWGR